MCRLFGLHAGREPVSATFWLLEAPGSLLEQSHRNPDGFGLGTFEPDGSPEVDKAPLAAHVAELFAREAREECSTTYVAHVRYASASATLTLENTHPFVLDGRIFGHNGIVGDLDRVEAELGDLRDELLGTTDSERLFALITRHIRDHDGDVQRRHRQRDALAGRERRALLAELRHGDRRGAVGAALPGGQRAVGAAPRAPTTSRSTSTARTARSTSHMEAAREHAGRRRRQREDGRRPALARGPAPASSLRVGPDLDLSVDLVLPDPPAHLMELDGPGGRVADRVGRAERSAAEDAAARVGRVAAELLLDAQELVVLRDAVRARRARRS